MLKNLTVVGIGNLINALGGFFYLISAAKVLNPDNLGRYTLLLATFIFLSKFTELGTTSSFVTRSIKNGKDYSQPLAILKALMTTLVFFLAVPLLFAYNQLNIFTTLIFLIGFIGYALNDYVFAIFQLKQQFVLATLANTIPALLKFVAGIYLLTRGSGLLNEALFFYFTALISCVFLLPFALQKSLIPRIENMYGIKDLAKFGFLGGSSQALNISIQAINSNILNFVSTLSSVGTFGLAEKISSIFGLASLSIFTVLLPNKAYEAKEKSQYSLKLSVSLGVCIFAAMAAMLILIRPVIYFIFPFPPNYLIPTLYLLTIGSAINSISLFLDNYFYVFEKTLLLLKISTLKIVLLLIFGVVLTVRYGILGLAWTNLIVFLLILILTIALISKNRVTLNPSD